jgi:hypothetical protein
VIADAHYVASTQKYARRLRDYCPDRSRLFKYRCSAKSEFISFAPLLAPAPLAAGILLTTVVPYAAAIAHA